MSGTINWPPQIDRETCKPLYEWKVDKVEDQVNSLGTMFYEIRLQDQHRFDELLWVIGGLALGVVLLGIVTLFMLIYFINNFTI